ncbi:transcriptional regulator [Bacteroidia bacterium]|nr:transcriptional regulator [Bacteroidia bacterium]
MEQEKSPFEIVNLKEDTGFLMWQVSKLWELTHERVLKRYYNLSHIQYAVLASIHWLTLHSKKEISQVLLAQHTKIDPMTISQLLKVLEAKGYILRQTHSTDVRAKSICLTQQGKDLMNEAVFTVTKLNVNFFKILGKNLPRFNQLMIDILNAND